MGDMGGMANLPIGRIGLTRVRGVALGGAPNGKLNVKEWKPFVAFVSSVFLRFPTIFLSLPCAFAHRKIETK